MKRRSLLKKTMTLARTGDIESFENFYILTVQETYGKLTVLVKDREKAEELLLEVYAALYHQVHTLPLEEEDLVYRIEEEIYHQAEKKLGTALGKIDIDSGYEALGEDKAATLWLALEEKTGLNREETEEEINSWTSYLYILIKVAVTIAVLIGTVAILYKGWLHFIENGTEKAAEAANTQMESESRENTLVVEEEKKEPGWQQNPDKKLFYVTKDGILADGQIAIGKQLLTFSRSGELTLIGANREVAENAALSFDEDVRYEVRDGDVYRRDPETGEEECVVRNGHVLMADIRCGYLWYICEYQIPNTSQTKTTVYRAMSDGERSEEIYTTDSVLQTEQFQLTSKWMYFISNGRLFRKNLKTEKTEFLAEDVEHYFAWEDTAYYMADRTLEHVSEGSDYDGMEAGFQIEKTSRGFVLSNLLGEEAVENGTGEVQTGDRIYQLEDSVITSVRPAKRTVNDVTYYIDDSSLERKIYWKDSSGSRGLVPQEGISADSLCIVEDWLYYSARTAQYGAECESQIYRVNLKTMSLERVGGRFRGYMRNLYYFDNMQTILGEYIPSTADPNQIHGSIAKVAVDEMGVVNDTTVRPDYSGSDMLELVMADGNQIYCLYHQCTYDSGTGQMTWQSSEPLEIEFKGYGTGG